MRNKVVLPLPFGPTSTYPLPASSPRLASLNSTRSPKRLSSPSSANSQSLIPERSVDADSDYDQHTAERNALCKFAFGGFERNGGGNVPRQPGDVSAYHDRAADFRYDPTEAIEDRSHDAEADFKQRGQRCTHSRCAETPRRLVDARICALHRS